MEESGGVKKAPKGAGGGSREDYNDADQQIRKLLPVVTAKICCLTVVSKLSSRRQGTISVY